jgi:hypothetical protein
MILPLQSNLPSCAKFIEAMLVVAADFPSRIIAGIDYFRFASFRRFACSTQITTQVIRNSNSIESSLVVALLNLISTLLNLISMLLNLISMLLNLISTLLHLLHLPPT